MSYSSSTASIDDAGPFVIFRFEDLSSTLLSDVMGGAGDGEPNLSLSPNELETSDGEILVELSLMIDVGQTEYSDSTDSNNSCAVSPSSSERTTDTDGDAAECESDGIESTLNSVRTNSVPAYEDTEYLRRLYELSETFDEMSDRIVMDVSAETVRRYMIDAGIHSSESYATTHQNQSAKSTGGSVENYAQSVEGAQTGSTYDSEDSTSVRSGKPRPELDRSGADYAESLPKKDLLTDGVGLPDDVTLQELVEIVVQARTVHEVHRRLDIDHVRTRELLRLNVLDLVVNRISTETERY